jgi:SAM-dependent methyltransferase
MNIEYFKNLWTIQKDENKNIEEFWDSRADEFNNRVDMILEKDPIEFLKESNHLNAVSDVLDIGCGPGKYSMKFAQFSKNVLGVDVSDKMLKYAEMNAKNKGLGNINFKKAYWEDIDLKKHTLEKKFDVVFASMCPGINSYTALEKMNKASKGICFVSGFVERKDKLWDKLKNQIKVQDKKRFYGKKIYCIFNLLWLMGYFPKIKYVDRHWKNQWSLSYITKMYIKRLEMKSSLSDEEKEQVKEFLKEHNEDDKVEETIEAKIAWIYWDVKN